MSGKRNRQKRSAAVDPRPQPAADQPIAAASTAPPPAHGGRFWVWLSISLIVISCGLMFFRLGHYPLWSDEADTALFARGVARSGDTLALVDHNIFADRNGAGLVNLRGRYQPPLPFYLAAPFVGRDGTGSFWPRFPFALCGVASAALVVYWLRRDGTSNLFWVVMALGFAMNVALLLYFRQCRYNALATLLSLAAVYCYLHWDGRRRMLVAFSALVVALMMTHYIPYAGLMVGVAADYLLFGRRQRRLSLRDWAIVLVPQIVVGVVAVSVWNSMSKEVTPTFADRSWLLDKLTLVWWNLRDINAGEFGVGLFMLAAPALYFLDRNSWLLRAPVAILAYVLVVSLASPQPVVATSKADIRYLTALIPLCIFLTGLAIVTMSRQRWAIAVPLAIVAFGTNALHVPWNPPSWRATTCQFVDELWTARPTPTQLAINWINENVQPGQSIWVWPDFQTWPLIYHAPHALYAWQLKPPPQGQFMDLPAIHFFGTAPPDFILEFGRRQEVKTAIAAAQQKLQLTYEPAGALDIYFADWTRPELLWHRFKPTVQFNPAVEAVYVWRRADLRGPPRAVR